jgi:anthranilate phosphoribosyltransferase
MFRDLLQKVMRKEDLTEAEAAQVMDDIVEGRVAPAQVAGMLVGLAMKGERPAEIVGLARSMRSRAVTIAAPAGGTVDLCGTGGDAAGTFNISSVASIVAAACGLTVAKHGNRSVSSRCGSADVFEALGVNVSATPATADRCLQGARFAFLFAPSFHPSMRNVASVRRDLGVRTAFNLLGPLTNPTCPAFQLVGVPRPELTELLARALSMLGSTRAWVVHGADGLDELSTTGYTKVSECRAGAVNTFYVHPADVGLPKAPLAALAGGDAAANAAIARRVLGGEQGAARDIVLLNAGAALFVAGRAPHLLDGLRMAAAAIDSGAAQRTLDALVRISSAGDSVPAGEGGAS